MDFLVLFLIFAVISPSLQISKTEGKQEIEDYRTASEKRLRATLGKVDGSVLRTPLRLLKELETAGKDDLDAIAAFQGTGDNKDTATRQSVLFWSGKMDQAIQKYIENPQRYRGLIIDFVRTPEDPHWNDSEAYKKLEKELNSMSEEGISKLENELQKRALPAEKLSEVTAVSWKKLEAERAFEDAKLSIVISRQWTKSDAAMGKDSETLINRLKKVISDSASEFNSKLHEIYK